MKKTTLFLALASIGIGFTACKNTAKTPEVAVKDGTEVASETPSSQSAPMCFLLVENKVDSTKVSLKTAGNEVMGEMAWLPHEKDAAIGKLKGSRVGDTLKLTYDYVIEGSAQQEQKWFLLKDGALSMGEGELVDKNGKIEYKDTKKIKFGAPFTKVECK